MLHLERSSYTRAPTAGFTGTSRTGIFSGPKRLAHDARAPRRQLLRPRENDGVAARLLRNVEHVLVGPTNSGLQAHVLDRPRVVAGEEFGRLDVTTVDVGRGARSRAGAELSRSAEGGVLQLEV